MLYSLYVSSGKTRNALFRQIEADDVALAVFIGSDWQRPTWPNVYPDRYDATGCNWYVSDGMLTTKVQVLNNPRRTV